MEVIFILPTYLIRDGIWLNFLTTDNLLINVDVLEMLQFLPETKLVSNPFQKAFEILPDIQWHRTSTSLGLSDNQCNCQNDCKLQHV